jgi:hypothetical protein
VESESGRSKGIGGKERVILTTHSAAYDAKTRSGLAEELPMTWESVAHLFAASKPAAVAEKEVPAWQFEIERHGEDVNAFLRAKGMINSGQKWRDAGSKALARIEADPAAFWRRCASGGGRSERNPSIIPSQARRVPGVRWRWRLL